MTRYITRDVTRDVMRDSFPHNRVWYHQKRLWCGFL